MLLEVVLKQNNYTETYYKVYCFFFENKAHYEKNVINGFVWSTYFFFIFDVTHNLEATEKKKVKT